MGSTGLGPFTDLTIGEKLYIIRRRRGESQVKAADRFRVSRSTYGRWENEILEGPHLNVLTLRDHERCFMYRKRAGMNQEEAAKLIKTKENKEGISRWWLVQMESGRHNCGIVLDFWLDREEKKMKLSA